MHSLGFMETVWIAYNSGIQPGVREDNLGVRKISPTGQNYFN
jgi:hypothetical protein